MQGSDGTSRDLTERFPPISRSGENLKQCLSLPFHQLGCFRFWQASVHPSSNCPRERLSFADFPIIPLNYELLVMISFA